MKCQVCGDLADVHVTDIRDGKKYHYHLCSRHKSASGDGSVQPLSDEQEKRMLREQFESSIKDPATLEQIKRTFPEIFDDERAGGDPS